MRSHPIMTAVLLATVAFFCAAPQVVQSSEPADVDAEVDKDAQIADLTARVAELERRLEELEAKALPLIEQAQAKQRRDRARTAARTRMRRDRGKYSPEVLGKVEELYQTANRQWQSPEAREALEKLINDYPDLNRTGCATMYLAQMTEGPERADYLMRAMNDFADCYYGDGVNVGAYATYYLACDQWQAGNYDDAKPLIKKIKTQYADAIDHRGRALVDQLREMGMNASPDHEQADVFETP